MKYKEKYLKEGGASCCPFCGSKRVIATEHTLNTGTHSASQTMRCYICKAKWDDFYKLTGIIPHAKPD
jgi:formate dehydrogenase maturation protein FdhE